MRDGEACPDCQWTTYLLSGRPILFLRCDACKNWYHCNVRVVRREPSVAGPVLTLEATLNYECPKGQLNSMLRCDCLAPQIFLGHVPCCDRCGYDHRFDDLGLRRCTHRIQLSPWDTLHACILALTKQRYDKSHLPAYTLQRRCGAIERYVNRYIDRVATEDQATRTRQYRQRRLEVRNGKREN